MHFVKQACMLQIVAGNRAGTLTILLDTLGLHGDQSQLEGELKPTHTVRSLADIAGLLQDQYNLQRPVQISSEL